MSSQKLASSCSASDLPPANQSAGSTASTMTAVTFGSLWRIFAASSTLAPPCGVQAIAVRALDKAGIAWREAFWRRRRYSGGSRGVGGARCRAAGKTHSAIRLDRVGPAQDLPRLESSKVMLHSNVSEPSKLAALRTLAATFRSVVGT